MELVVEIVLAVLASVRGWGVGPYIIVAGAYVLKLVVQLATGDGFEGLMQALDLAVVAALTIMALKGRKRPKKAGKVP
jgi:hypothetical protein